MYGVNVTQQVEECKTDRNSLHTRRDVFGETQGRSMIINDGADVPRTCLDPRCLLNVQLDIPLRVALYMHTSVSLSVCVCVCVHA